MSGRPALARDPATPPPQAVQDSPSNPPVDAAMADGCHTADSPSTSAAAASAGAGPDQPALPDLPTGPLTEQQRDRAAALADLAERRIELGVALLATAEQRAGQNTALVSEVRKLVDALSGVAALAELSETHDGTDGGAGGGTDGAAAESTGLAMLQSAVIRIATQLDDAVGRLDRMEQHAAASRASVEELVSALRRQLGIDDMPSHHDKRDAGHTPLPLVGEVFDPQPPIDERPAPASISASRFPMQQAQSPPPHQVKSPAENEEESQEECPPAKKVEPR